MSSVGTEKGPVWQKVVLLPCASLQLLNAMMVHAVFVALFIETAMGPGRFSLWHFLFLIMPLITAFFLWTSYQLSIFARGRLSSAITPADAAQRKLAWTSAVAWTALSMFMLILQIRILYAWSLRVSPSVPTIYYGGSSF